MSQSNEGLLSLGGLTIDPGTLVRVPEPTEAASAVLCQRLMSGTYDKPFLVEDGKRRALCFTIDGSVQSEMRIDDPDALVNDYTRKMMGFLLFCPEPRRILMIGLGGGSLVKFCSRRLPSTHVTAVEIDANVIALREHFRIPPDGKDLRVVHGDGARYVADLVDVTQFPDVLLVDAYDRNGISPSIAEYEFLEHSRRILRDTGVFVMNLAAHESASAMQVERVRHVFGEPVIPVTVGWGGNMVVFAGPAVRDRQRLAAAPANARRVQKTLDLDFRILSGLVQKHLQHAQ
ncbi:MAG: spermidine synthase-like protein [Gammaproteobacteria bacterium]|nr:spermidine synthase-like protein [Gammaproteobacteria bacterium]MDH4311150.1 spermidine synthase-like protein [Gammaproteobacteria bacterium]